MTMPYNGTDSALANPSQFSGGASLLKQIDTGVSGVSLVNGTPVIGSYTTPNDGKLHVAIVAMELNVTSGETGGIISVNVFGPDGANHQRQAFAGNLATGFSFFASNFVIAPNQVFSIAQTSALTGGAAVLYAQAWIA